MRIGQNSLTENRFSPFLISYLVVILGSKNLCSFLVKHPPLSILLPSPFVSTVLALATPAWTFFTNIYLEHSELYKFWTLDKHEKKNNKFSQVPRTCSSALKLNFFVCVYFVILWLSPCQLCSRTCFICRGHVDTRQTWSGPRTLPDLCWTSVHAFLSSVNKMLQILQKS